MRSRKPGAEPSDGFRRGLLRLGSTALKAGMLLGLLCGPASLRADEDLNGLVRSVEGTLYEIGSRRQKVLFRWELWATPDGQIRKSRFFTSDGTLNASEELILNDDRFQQYTVIHHQADQWGRIRRVDDGIEFSYTKDGHTKTDTERYVPNFVAGPMMLVSRVQSHWTEILAGKDLKVRVGVPDRRETVGFTIRKKREAQQNGRSVVILEMKPSSFLIAALVNPILFTLSPDGRTVYDVVGRTIPLHRVGNRWKHTEVEGVYRPVTAAAAAPAS